MDIDVKIGDKKESIKKQDYHLICENMRKRIVTILYLKEEFEKNKVESKSEEIERYIDSLEYELYGMYKIFGKHQFISCIAELEGIRINECKSLVRKKILDLSNFVCKI